MTIRLMYRLTVTYTKNMFGLVDRNKNKTKLTMSGSHGLSKMRSSEAMTLD